MLVSDTWSFEYNTQDCNNSLIWHPMGKRVGHRSLHIKEVSLGTSSNASGFTCGSAGKESACNAGELGSIPGLGRSPGGGKGYPLQCSDLENSMDCIVHGITKSQTWLNDFHFHFPEHHPLESSQLCEMNTITLSHFTNKKNSVSLNNWVRVA